MSCAPVFVPLNLAFLDPPGKPVITGYTPGEPIKKGSRVTLSCSSEGGNPPATLTWDREGERIDNSDTDLEEGATNTHEFIATVSKFGVNLKIL